MAQPDVVILCNTQVNTNLFYYQCIIQQEQVKPTTDSGFSNCSCGEALS